MAQQTQEGFLVLADISGYTSFLSEAELDHAREIIADLLELITGRLSPVLTVAKLEGDAVFAYAPSFRIPRRELILEALDSTYAAFRNRIQSGQRHTICGCNGCRAMPRLDLKFIVHYGTFAFQRVAGHEELVGQDVVVVHRLLKNRVPEKTGFKAYVVLTRQALNQIGIDPAAMVHGGESSTISAPQTHSAQISMRDTRSMRNRGKPTSRNGILISFCELNFPFPPR